jgi:hypothetical protein
MLTYADEAPRLRAALRYMVYGKGNTFDVDRLIELLQARMLPYADVC